VYNSSYSLECLWVSLEIDADGYEDSSRTNRSRLLMVCRGHRELVAVAQVWEWQLVEEVDVVEFVVENASFVGRPGGYAIVSLDLGFQLGITRLGLLQTRVVYIVLAEWIERLIMGRGEKGKKVLLRFISSLVLGQYFR
jgi:hypothetical protein